MAFPFVFEENFEDGTKGNFDTETDTVSQLDFPDFKALAAFPFKGFVPYSGAFTARWTLSGGTADAILLEADINISLATENFFRFPVYFSPDFAGTADDTVHLFELHSAGAVIQAVVGFRVVAATGVINMGIGELVPTSFSAIAIERGVHYTIELRALIDSGGGNDGTLGLFITKDGETTQPETVTVATLDQLAITDGVLGVQNHLATTTGIILIDHLVQDDARLFPKIRYNRHKSITLSEHLFVGRGKIKYAALTSITAGNVMTLHDTDDGTATLENEVLNLAVGGVLEYHNDVIFSKGCFANVTGTNVKAEVILSDDDTGPRNLNDANVKRYGMQA